MCYCILARPHESHSRGTAMPMELRKETDMDHNNFLGKMPWLQSFSPPNVRFPQSTSQHWRRPTASGTGNFRAPVGCSRRTIFSLRFAFPPKPATDLLTHLEVRQWRIDIQIHEGMAVHALNFGTRIGEKRNETAAPGFTGSTTRK